MNFHIITIFPEMMRPFTEEGILGRAKNLKKIINIEFHNPRDFAKDSHKTVDDRPFGGGPGMVLKAHPILQTVESVLNKLGARRKKLNAKIIILSPRGKKFDNKMAKKLARNYENLILISGRYEGIDARVKKILKAEEVSIGDYVLSGGEIPAMVIVDAVARKISGVLGKEESLEENRVAPEMVYTRPEVLEWHGKNHKVPKVLLSGNHAKIEEWREKC